MQEQSDTDMSSLSRHYPFPTVLWRLVALFCLLLLQNGCGYHNPYISTGSAQQDPVSLHLDVWTNLTNELGLEASLHRSLTGWFQKSGHIKLTNNRDQADLLLFGEITAINLPGVTYGLHDQITELEARLTVSCTLQDRQTGDILWQEQRLTLTESFSVGSGSEETRANKELALTRITRDLSETIYLNSHRAVPIKKAR